MNRRLAETLALVAVICLAAIVRIELAGRHGLWADEVFSLAIATGHSLEHPASVAEPALGDYVEPRAPVPAAAFQRYLEHDMPQAGLLRVVRAVRLSDTNPPLYYLLLHVWTRALGTTDFVLRGFSLFWAIATFPLIAHLGRRAGGAPAVLPAWILLAAAPASLQYAVEGRMYSLLWFLATGLAAATLHLARRASSLGPLALWILTGTLGLLTHYFFVFVWVACAMWLALRVGGRATCRVGTAVLSTLALVSPWYIQIPATLAQWRVTGRWLHGFPGSRHAVRAPFDLAWSLLSAGGPWAIGSRWNWLVGLLLLVLAIGLWRRLGFRMFSGPRALLWMCVFAAALGPVVLDIALGTRSSLFSRYALAALPAALVLVALALSRLRPLARFAMLLILVIAWASPSRAILGSPARGGHPTRLIGEILAPLDHDADVVLVHSIPSGVLGVARYLPRDVPMASWVGQLGQRRVPEDVRAIAAGRRRLVLVKVHAVGAPAPEEDWLRAHAAILGELALGRAQLVTFRPAEGSQFP